jgi:hypothetical protein
MRTFVLCAVIAAGCSTSETPAPAGATVVGRIQGTEFLEPNDAAAIWLLGTGLGALRLSQDTDGCGAPAGWSLLVQVNLEVDGHYQLGDRDGAPGRGFLAEYRRDDGSLDMPSAASGTLDLVAQDDAAVAGALVLLTPDNATLTAVFSAPVCPATTLVTP